MAVAPALRFTYEDYLLLPEDRRYEILDGDLFMTPAPTPYHQRVSLNLTFRLLQHVRERNLGELLEAPCDVVLSKTNGPNANSWKYVPLSPAGLSPRRLNSLAM